MSANSANGSACPNEAPRSALSGSQILLPTRSRTPRKSDPIPPATHRHEVECQIRCNLVKQCQRVFGFAVDLVDERDDGDIAQPADFEQLARLALDAFRRVDDHDRGVDRPQRPIVSSLKSEWPGVSSRLKTMPLRSNVITDEVTRCRVAARSASSRNAFDAVAARLDGTRHPDRSAKQEELFRQRRLARVGMRDDRERAASRDLGRHCPIRPARIAASRSKFRPRSILPGSARARSDDKSAGLPKTSPTCSSTRSPSNLTIGNVFPRQPRNSICNCLLSGEGHRAPLHANLVTNFHAVSKS